MPEGYSAGLTILRLIVKVVFAAQSAADVVNALLAFYVAVRPGIVEVPNLNADLLDYYLFSGLQAPATAGAAQSAQVFDIRSKRRLRGDRDLLLRVTNNEVTGMQIGVETRFLLQQS